MAHKGTLFLDEIGEMDLQMQAKLLRALQEREFTRVGGNQLVKIDVRIIIASHRDLKEEVKKGNFREDLYYRLLGLTIEIPPLRSRGTDIMTLAKNFLDEFCKSNALSAMTFSDEAKHKLNSYRFPGNVRELKAIVELAAVLSDTPEIPAAAVTLQSLDTPTLDVTKEEFTLEEYTRRLVAHYLDKYDYRVNIVADKLGVGKSTLYRMIKQDDVLNKRLKGF